MEFGNLRVKEIRSVIKYRPDVLKWKTHERKDHIIGIKLKGSALHTMKTQNFVISADCIYFLNQKDDYQVEVFEESEALSIHFTTYEEIETESFCFHVSNAEMIIRHLQKAEIAKSSNNELNLLSVFYEICDTFEKIRLKPYAQKDDRIMRAKTYIDQHFTEKNCLETALCISALGERRFKDLFQLFFHATPSKYVISKKMTLAQNLLSAGGVSVTDASARCGFSDVYYFSKVFKNFCGRSPSKWK